MQASHSEANAEPREQSAISSENMVNPRVLKIIRMLLSAVVFYSVVLRSIYSWNREIPALLYFTVLTNLFCGLYWFFGSLFPALRTKTTSFLLTTYAAITGIVFMILLNYGFINTIYAKMVTGEITYATHYYAMSISNITHQIVPLLMVVDFLVFTDMRTEKRNRLLVIAYPVGYCIVALVYAAVTGNYVYPLIDPGFVGGWWAVALIIAGIMGAVLLVSKGLFALNKKIQTKIETYYRAVLNMNRME